MLYRIRIDLAFDTYDPIDDIKDKALDHLQEAHTINPDQPNEEKGFIIIEECHHDLDPSMPCQFLEVHYTS